MIVNFTVDREKNEMDNISMRNAFVSQFFLKFSEELFFIFRNKSEFSESIEDSSGSNGTVTGPVVWSECPGNAVSNVCAGTR